MRPTRPSTLVALLAVATALVWGVLRVADRYGTSLPDLDWLAPVGITVLAVAVLVSWVAVRSRLRGDRPPNPLGVARMAVLGKASAHVGPIVGGFYLGYLLVLLPGVEATSRRDRAVIAVVALAAAVLLTVAGLLSSGPAGSAGGTRVPTCRTTWTTRRRTADGRTLLLAAVGSHAHGHPREVRPEQQQVVERRHPDGHCEEAESAHQNQPDPGLPGSAPEQSPAPADAPDREQQEPQQEEHEHPFPRLAGHRTADAVRRGEGRLQDHAGLHDAWPPPTGPAAREGAHDEQHERPPDGLAGPEGEVPSLAVVAVQPEGLDGDRDGEDECRESGTGCRCHVSSGWCLGRCQAMTWTLGSGRSPVVCLTTRSRSASRQTRTGSGLTTVRAVQWPTIARGSFLLVVAVLVVTTQVQVWTGDGTVGEQALHAVAALAVTLPLVLVRRWPLVVLLVVLGGAALDQALGGGLGQVWFSLLLAVFGLGRYAGHRASAVGAVLLAFAVLAVDLPRLQDGVPLDEVLPGWFILAGTWGLGRWLRWRRVEHDRLLDHNATLEQDRDEATRAAVAYERARIATELHDSSPTRWRHRPAGAGSGPGHATPTPERGVRRSRPSRTSGRQGLVELRRLVEVLVVDAEVDLSPPPEPAPPR